MMEKYVYDKNNTTKINLYEILHYYMKIQKKYWNLQLKKIGC